MKLSRSFLIALLLVCQLITSAAWLTNEPQTINQPDGAVIHCFATGDEFYNWLHDANGFTIIQNHETGFYTYAILENGVLKPSQYIVGQAEPVVLGLKPWTNIPPEEMQKFRSDFFKTQMPAAPAIPGFNAPGSTRNIGTLNNLVVYIRFSDQTEYTEDTTVFTNMFNNDEPEYSSMLNYFRFASYNKLSVPSLFYPVPPASTVISYQDIYPRAYYMPYDPITNPQGYQEGQVAGREHALLKRAIEHIDEEVPADLNIDYNNDGYVDNMVFIVKGTTTAWATLLWPHRWALYSYNVYINGKRVYDYNFQIQNHLMSSGNGVLCHEMNHSLGAPDLYHYTSQPVDAVGDWDVMCANHNPPQSMGAYMKFRYGDWIDEIPEITECGTYTINPVTSEFNNCYKIASPNSSTDIFIVEYRIKDGTFEGTLPSSGLLVYKINTLEDGNGNASGPPDEVYIYRPNGTLTVNGNLAQAAFAEDFGRTEFNDNTNPQGFLSNGQPAGIDIFNIGSIGQTITFEVNLKKAPVADFSVSANLITGNCSVDFTDLSVCEVDSWNWTFNGGNPATSNLQHPTGILYQNAGVYDVTLTTTNQYGSNTKVFENLITVSTSALPEVHFMAADTMVCTGGTVNFLDQSEVCPTGWLWEISSEGFEFVNGTTATSQNPEVVFNGSGLFSVTLTTTNANGSNSLTKENYIFAGGINAESFVGSFESVTLESAGWTVENPDNAITWAIYDVGGSGAGTKAAGINFYNYYAFNQHDRLISPPLNLTASGAYFLNFKHAYARTNMMYTDSLVVKISLDCGETWIRLMSVADDGSGNFVTREPLNQSFIPQTPEDWCGEGFGTDCYSLDISMAAGHENVKIMFDAVKIIGNNLYIDDVRVDMLENTGETAGIPGSNFTLYPNPSTGIFTVSMNSGADCHLQILNVQGRVVFEEIISSATRTRTINLSDFSDGIYLVRLSGNGFSETKKVVLKR